MPVIITKKFSELITVNSGGYRIYGWNGAAMDGYKIIGTSISINDTSVTAVSASCNTYNDTQLFITLTSHLTSQYNVPVTVTLTYLKV